MDIFAVLTMIGGLCLFLFGMNVMGSALEKRAGDSLKSILAKLTTSRWIGFLTGVAVTGVIQSSSATTVMVVGFVNSGVMNLKQAINVIMGANVGTTVTAWILSLTGIESSNTFVQLLKPASFTPVLAAIGIVLFMMCKSSKKNDTGMILLGFATLMFGMDIMSDSVSGLRSMPEYQNVLLMFSHPILGVLAGLVLTAIIQSSSAAVGILQALSTTGQVTIGAAIPILMGMDIGTCVTALLASVGTNRNARRAAVVHLLFNVIGTVVWLTLFTVLNAIIGFEFMTDPINQLGIAIVNTAFKGLNVCMLLPITGVLEKIAIRLVPDRKDGNQISELDERLLVTPAIALERCRVVAGDMLRASQEAVELAMEAVIDHDKEKAAMVRKLESEADRYEDVLGTYLVHLSSRPMSEYDSNECAKLLLIIGDLERMSDHAVNILESGEELQDKGIAFTPGAAQELEVLMQAVREVVELSGKALRDSDMVAAARVEPLEQVVDTLKEQLRARHILRLQRGECSIEAGFVWSDLLTNLERIADHCSNIAGSVIEISHSAFDLHQYLRGVKAGSEEFAAQYQEFARKYALLKR